MSGPIGGTRVFQKGEGDGDGERRNYWEANSMSLAYFSFSFGESGGQWALLGEAFPTQPHANPNSGAAMVDPCKPPTLPLPSEQLANGPYRK